MLVIRLQRTGRKGYAMYRFVVQDSRRTPTSGRVVAYLGSYDPHAKTTILKKDQAEFYLNHGAQPSARIISLFKAEKVKIPSWVEESKLQNRKVKNPEKRRSTAAKTDSSEPVNDTAEKIASEPVVQESVEAENIQVQE